MASDRPGIFRILDLPTDILHLILEEFQHDRATLLNLTLVCRPISAIARPLVFWHLDDATEDDIPILQILFDERPELKLYVRSCPPTVFDAEGCPSVNDEGKPPWLCFPNLHQLNLQRDGKDYDLGFPWEDEEDDDLDKYPKQRTIENAIKISLIPDSLSNVRSVTLNSTADSDGFGGTYSVADFSLIDIIHLLMLPNIRRLRANRLGPLGTLPNLDSFRQTPSSITCLEVYGSSHWSCEPWQIAELLSFCPCLRKLGCFMPMLTVYPEPPIGGLTELVCREVCPAAFDRMLEPVKNTLTHLSLIDWRYETQYDGTFMDFRTYPSLEILEINACCVLPPGAPGPERAKMFERLPKSLRALVLTFPRVSGIFYYHNEWDYSKSPPENIFDNQPENWDDIPEARTAWLLDFLTHKPNRFPQLQSVKLQDPPGQTGDFRWLNVWWDPSNEIYGRFMDAGIALKVKVSYPNPAWKKGIGRLASKQPNYSPIYPSQPWVDDDGEPPFSPTVEVRTKLGYVKNYNDKSYTALAEMSV